jgi:hypothetical protein
MPYPRIISLIDAELDRLRKARRLLASFFIPAEKTQGSRLRKAQPRMLPSPVHSVADEITDGEVVLPSLPQKAGPQARPARRPKSEPVVTLQIRPLDGAIPERPVFVPAEQVRQIQAQRPEGQSSDQSVSSSAPGGLPTVELLRQKWLQNLSS